MNTNNLQSKKNKNKIINYILNNPGNYFIHGKAGTGKSTFIKEFVKEVKNTLVLATTGIAAINVGGVTLHSFFGIGQDSIHFDDRPNNVAIFMKSEYIIIDEVSMLRADLLELIDKTIRGITQSSEFFGGKKVIFVGDLYQLPPVLKSEEKEYFFNHYETEYFFGYEGIYDANINLIELEKVWRQAEDGEYLEILNRIRKAKQTKQDLYTLNKKVSKDIPEDTIYLASTNKVVSDINDKFLLENPNKLVISYADIDGDISPSFYPTDEILKLKNGAQVISIINNPNNPLIRNGTRGIIKSINEEKRTIEIDFYTTSIDGKDIVITELVSPFTWEVKEPEIDLESGDINYLSKGLFKQFPIKIAYAITIHKSQGLTFDRAHIDLGKFAFAKHMVYVALSRIKSMDGLTLKRPIYYKEIKTDPIIDKFLSIVNKIKIEL